MSRWPPLRLEVITPDGDRWVEDAVDAVVVRRREARFPLGSEVAILPGHAPLLMRIASAPLRYRAGGRTAVIDVDGGFVEVKHGRVRVLTPHASAPR